MSGLKTVLLSGASSQLGVFLLPRLHSAGFRVTALSRRAPARPLQVADSLIWVQTEPGYRQDGEARFLISCGPLGLARRLIRNHAGLDRAVVFSTSSILSKSDSDVPDESRQMAELVEQERRLKALCAERSLALLLLRPTLIYGCGLDRNISVLAGLGERFGIIPLAGKASGLRQPVHADDLADLAVRAITADTPLKLESQVCGGSTLSYRNMVERIALACEGTVRILTLPAWLMARTVRVLSLMGPCKGLNAAMVHRQNQNLVFDDSVLREKLGYDPRPFCPGPADFEIPDYAKRFQLP